MVLKEDDLNKQARAKKLNEVLIYCGLPSNEGSYLRFNANMMRVNFYTWTETRSALRGWIIFAVKPAV